MKKVWMKMILMGVAFFVSGVSFSSVGAVDSNLMQEQVKSKYDYIVPLEQNISLAYLKTDAGVKQGIINSISGMEIIPVVYDEIRDYNNGLAIVVLNKKYGMVNNKNEKVLPIIYEYIVFQQDGTARVQL